MTNKKTQSIQNNPYNPQNNPQKTSNHFKKLSGQKKKSKDKKIWHIAINSKRRIFYTINKGEIVIEKITYDGIVNILSAYSHDVRRK